MQRITISVLAILLANAHCAAEVKIAAKNRVPNRPGGYCCYAAIETIGRHFGCERLFRMNTAKPMGLVDWYAQWASIGAHDEDVRACLNNLDVGYTIHHHQTLSWLKRMTDAGHPVVIGIPRHVLVVVDVEGDWMKTVDSNWIGGHTWYDRRWWDGWALEIKP